MIASLLIPGFELRAALRKQPGLALRPAALAPLPGTEPLLGPVTAAAERRGVRPGMRLGEALATCPGLVLVEQDPAAAEQAWEEILRALEDSGFAVEPAEPGCVYFETRGVERLYGGLEQALERALAAVGSGWEFEGSASLPGCRAVPSPNVWGRTAGTPGAWRGVGRPRPRVGVGRAPRSPRRSSSRRRSTTSSRFGARSRRSSTRSSPVPSG